MSFGFAPKMRSLCMLTRCNEKMFSEAQLVAGDSSMDWKAIVDTYQIHHERVVQIDVSQLVVWDTVRNINRLQVQALISDMLVRATYGVYSSPYREMDCALKHRSTCCTNGMKFLPEIRWS